MDKQTKKWVQYDSEECPKCGTRTAHVLTRSTEDNFIYDGEEARCFTCQHTGVVSVEDSECADIIWDELEQSNKSTSQINNELQSQVISLKSRITLLEKQNSELREALEEINGLDARSDARPDLYDAKQIAYKAIIKAEQALSSKENV